MKQYEEIKGYAKKCISGEFISCKKHKWACMRFLRDAEKAENFLFSGIPRGRWPESRSH